MPEVSIIVPIYNKAHHLLKGIQSLQDQTLKDIEIILINDGSTDDSLEVCRNLAVSDDRIILIDQPNGGVSAARNAGLKRASGKYIGFMDPDDWVEPDMYRSMRERIKATGSEVCLCNFYFERAGGSIPVTLDGLPDCLDSQEVLQDLILNMLSADLTKPYRKEIMGSVFRLLIKGDHLVNHALQFEEQLTYMEDLIFTVHLLASVNKAALDGGIHYHYLVESASASKKYIPNLYDKLLEIMDHLEGALYEAGLYEEADERLEERRLFNAVRSVINEVHEDNSASYEETLLEIQRIIRDPSLKELLPTLDPKFMPEARRRALIHILDDRADKLYDYFKEKPYTLDPISD